MEASPMLFSGFTVLYCRRCARFRIAGDDRWFNKEAGLVQRLRARAEDLRGQSQTRCNDSH
jgi:hypothetical protein